MVRAYGVWRRSERQPLSDAAIAGLAVATGIGVAGGGTVGTLASTGRPDPVVAAVVVVAVAMAVFVVVVVATATVAAGRGRAVAAAFVFAAVLAAVGADRSDRAWQSLTPDRLGVYTGWARLVDDPQPYGPATRVVFDVEGERFESWQRAWSAIARADGWQAGESVMVSGERTGLAPDRAGRVAWQHVVGEFELEWAGDVAEGRPVDRASNRVRDAIERAAGHLPGDDGSLYRGLVVGDDRDQPREMIERFRRTGLSHLTAVSGQNVAFVLAAAGPLLVRLRAGWRWAVSVVLICWFVSLTRFEPSIVRAGTMAVLSATGYALGRERSAFRLLAWAVVALLIVDPLLAWSIGFWLSVGATCGVTTAGPWLTCRLRALGPLASPVGVTLGAQLGVVVPAVLVFGRLPLVTIPANLFAVPVAGFVMLYGLPAGLVAGMLPVVAPAVMLPCRVGTRWVDLVSIVADRLEPESPAVVAAGWGAVVTATTALAVRGRRERADEAVVSGEGAMSPRDSDHTSDAAMN